MAYFKIGTIDFSDIVSELSVKYSPVYNKHTIAAVNTVVFLLVSKIIIEVKIIPIDKDKMAALLAAIKNYNVELSYRDPITNELATGVQCLLKDIPIDYYRINSKVLYNETGLKFSEL